MKKYLTLLASSVFTLLFATTAFAEAYTWQSCGDTTTEEYPGTWRGNANFNSYSLTLGSGADKLNYTTFPNSGKVVLSEIKYALRGDNKIKPAYLVILEGSTEIARSTSITQTTDGMVVRFDAAANKYTRDSITAVFDPVVLDATKAYEIKAYNDSNTQVQITASCVSVGANTNPYMPAMQISGASLLFTTTESTITTESLNTLWTADTYWNAKTTTFIEVPENATIEISPDTTLKGLVHVYCAGDLNVSVPTDSPAPAETEIAKILTEATVHGVVHYGWAKSATATLGGEGATEVAWEAVPWDGGIAPATTDTVIITLEGDATLKLGVSPVEVAEVKIVKSSTLESNEIPVLTVEGVLDPTHITVTDTVYAFAGAADSTAATPTEVAYKIEGSGGVKITAGAVSFTHPETAYAGGTQIESTATVVIGNKDVLGTGAVTGSGTVQFGGATTTNVGGGAVNGQFVSPEALDFDENIFKTSNWTGTVRLKNITGNWIDFSLLGNANSKLAIDGLEGFLKQSANAGTEFTFAEIIVDASDWKINNGNNNQKTIFHGKLTGTGHIWLKDAQNTNYTLCFDGTVSEFKGTATIQNESNRNFRLIFGDSSKTTDSGKILIASTVAIASGKTWRARQGIVLDGILDLTTGDAGVSTIDCALAGNGTVKIGEGHSLKVTGSVANTIVFESAKEGYAVGKVDASTYTLVAANTAAINGTSYATIAEAIAALPTAGEGAVIDIVKDTNEAITLSANQSIILNGKGGSLSGAIIIPAGASLALTADEMYTVDTPWTLSAQVSNDGDLTTDGYIKLSNSNNYTYGTLLVNSDALTMNAQASGGTGYKGAITVSENAKFTPQGNYSMLVANGTATIDVYGVLNLDAIWSVTKDVTTFNFYPGSSVTGRSFNINPEATLNVVSLKNGEGNVIGTGSVKISASFTSNTNDNSANYYQPILNVEESMTLDLTSSFTNKRALVKQGAGVLLLNGSVQVAEGLKIEAGTVQFAKDECFGKGGFADGAYENPTYGNIEVNAEAVLDINGKKDCWIHVVTLGEGAILKNSASGTTNGERLIKGLTLLGNAKIDVANGVGLIAANHTPTTLELGTYALTKTGAGGFYLGDTTITGTGKLLVTEGATGFVSSYQNQKITIDGDITLSGNGCLADEMTVYVNDDKTVTLENVNGSFLVQPALNTTTGKAKITGTFAGAHVISVPVTFADKATYDITAETPTFSSTVTLAGALNVNVDEVDATTPILTATTLTAGEAFETGTITVNGVDTTDYELEVKDNGLYLKEIVKTVDYAVTFTGENATLTYTVGEAASPENFTATVGETITFTIAAEEGYTLDAVMLGEELLEIVNGTCTYTLTVAVADGREQNLAFTATTSAIPPAVKPVAPNAEVDLEATTEDEAEAALAGYEIKIADADAEAGVKASYYMWNLVKDGNTYKATPILDAAKVQPKFDKTTDGEPDVEITPESITLTVKEPKPGLWYGYMYTGDLTGTWSYSTFVRCEADGTLTGLGSVSVGTTKGFAKIVVSDTDLTPQK